MYLKIIKTLKERAKAKMENKPTQELTDIEIYTAIAQWEREVKENKALWKIIYDNKLEDLFHKKLEETWLFELEELYGDEKK